LNRGEGENPINRIGLLNESSLHEALKRMYAPTLCKEESRVGGYVVDILNADTIIEIQTGSFSKIREKISALLRDYRVNLVFPIAVEKTLVVYDDRMERVLYRRKSPKRGELLDVAHELVYIPELVVHPRFSLELLLTREEEIRSADGKGSWRRRGISIIDRKLLAVMSRVRFDGALDYLLFLPDRLPQFFTNRTISDMTGNPMPKIRKLTYSLRRMGVLQVVERQGKLQVFRIVR
jgi:hypothetical protein